MKVIHLFKEMLNSQSPISSKRFCGILGWITSVGVLVYCTLASVLAPEMINIFILSVVGLLGVDSVTNIWKSSHKDK